MINKKLYESIEDVLENDGKKMPPFLAKELNNCCKELEGITRSTDLETKNEILQQASVVRDRLKNARGLGATRILDEYIKTIK